VILKVPKNIVGNFATFLSKMIIQMAGTDFEIWKQPKKLFR
jgi:hypothetical protein